MSETIKKSEKFQIFIVAVITTVICFGSYLIFSAFAADEEDSDSETNENSSENLEVPDYSFDGVKHYYHQEMNALFNQRFEELAKILEGENFQDDPNFNPPSQIEEPFLSPEDDLETVIAKCGPKNVSTYCVSMEALQLYSEYIKNLDLLRGSTAEYQNQRELNNLLDAAGERSTKIDQEIEDARLVMESTLSAYNEFRLAYPMHKKYEEIIRNLNIYRLNLKDIRQKVVVFPSKFVDATTLYCE